MTDVVHPAPTPVTLPRLHWGSAEAARRVLLVHGLGSSAHTMWQLGEGLADAGWSATAVDLRGHGAAPRTSSYRIVDFAADLAATTPPDGPWDAVLGHSIGGAATNVASAHEPAWTRRLVLLDPAVRVSSERAETIRRNQLDAHSTATIADTAAQNPKWHPLSVELRVAAVRAASPFALEGAVLDNPRWDVTDEAARLVVPTLVIAGRAAQGGMFAGKLADDLLARNHHVRRVEIDAGHNVHREQPTLVIEHTLAAIDGRTRG